jgi:hypothetical protein
MGCQVRDLSENGGSQGTDLSEKGRRFLRRIEILCEWDDSLPGNDKGLSREFEGQPQRNGGGSSYLQKSLDKMEATDLEATTEATQAVVEWQECAETKR